jgi:hypothetical protein
LFDLSRDDDIREPEDTITGGTARATTRLSRNPAKLNGCVVLAFLVFFPRVAPLVETGDWAVRLTIEAKTLFNSPIQELPIPWHTQERLQQEYIDGWRVAEAHRTERIGGLVSTFEAEDPSVTALFYRLADLELGAAFTTYTKITLAFEICCRLWRPSTMQSLVLVTGQQYKDLRAELCVIVRFAAAPTVRYQTDPF